MLARITVLYALGHTLVGDVAWVAMFLVLAEVSFRFVERPLRARLAGGPGASGSPPLGQGSGVVPRHL